MLRLDLEQGIAFVAGIAFRFNETSYLALLGLLAIFSLFLVTILFGRLWCGYGCPQTVFVEWLYRPIEEWIEGSANHRRVVDQKPMDGKIFLRKLFKHSVFLGISVLIGNAFLAYFVSPQSLISWMQSSPVQHPYAFALMLTVSLATYFDFAWFREQFCSFLCPYARLQSVFIDAKTPTVAYDLHRGEPRGKRQVTGDCIDCGLCVRVCPTGIDIRNGLQLECIQCSRCVDACDRVMTNLKRPTGLIRHVSQMALSGQKDTNSFRWRPLIYGLGLLALLSLLIYRVQSRADLTIAVQRIPGVVAVPSSDAGVSEALVANIFHFRVQNTTSYPAKLSLSLVDRPEIELHCSMCAKDVEPLGVASGTVMLSAPKQQLPTEVRLLVEPGHQTLVLKLLP